MQYKKLLTIISVFLMISSCATKGGTQMLANNTNNQLKQQLNKTIEYTMPGEGEPHEGTWLQWPHKYGEFFDATDDLTPIWVAMTKALASSEKVHIIAYNQKEKTRIIGLLNQAKIPLTKVDFYLFKTDDVWARDNGPIYVRDKSGKLVIVDFGFNAWGRFKYELDNKIPAEIAKAQKRELVNLNQIMVLEGGAIEIDGNGTLMATKSSVLNPNRNQNMTQQQIEQILTKYLGVTNFIWLEGVLGLDSTDMHIDGFAKFANANTLVTMNRADLLAWDTPESDIDKLFQARNKVGIAYKLVIVPLSKYNVVTTYGKNLGYQGSYLNYYIGNKVVLVPNYKDPNDKVANQIIQSLYPDKKVIGIDVRDLIAEGGMIHCVTQQQPMDIVKTANPALQK